MTEGHMYFRKLVQWIREEFEAAPDLRLPTREAAAFLGLDVDMCDRVLASCWMPERSRGGLTAVSARAFVSLTEPTDGFHPCDPPLTGLEARVCAEIRRGWRRACFASS